MSLASSEGIRIFRSALRLSRKIPSEIIRRKFKFNVREALDFYSFEGNNNSTLANEQLERGWRVLKTLDGMLSSQAKHVEQVFKPFEYMESVLLKKPIESFETTLPPPLQYQEQGEQGQGGQEPIKPTEQQEQLESQEQQAPIEQLEQKEQLKSVKANEENRE